MSMLHESPKPKLPLSSISQALLNAMADCEEFATILRRRRIHA
jgi:hypothetical protein